MTDTAVCEFLAWDTEFFGVRIGRVNGHSLTEQSAEDVLDWARSNAIECLYFLSDFDDPETIRLAQLHGFQLIDIRIIFELNLKKNARSAAQPVSDVLIRPARPDDIPELESIAHKSYEVTRFHFDQRFPREKSDALYETWIRKSCQGYADQVLVADLERQPIGYITLSLLGNGQGQIGLVGVGEKARGRGVGKSLIYASIDWLAAQNVEIERVATQGRNIAAQRLYQSCGFLTSSVQLWHHKWLTSLVDPLDR